MRRAGSMQSRRPDLHVYPRRYYDDGLIHCSRWDQHASRWDSSSVWRMLLILGSYSLIFRVVLVVGAGRTDGDLMTVVEIKCSIRDCQREGKYQRDTHDEEEGFCFHDGSFEGLD
jgi:hypothetical protein